MLQFQHRLSPFHLPRRAPDATPFVSLYAGGRLCGCYGSDEGPPAERVARAFLRAAHDGRFPGVPAAEREALVGQVSYPSRPRRIDPETAAEEIEVGTHGIAFVRDRRPPVLLLPHVARDHRAGARELLGVLARKAGIAEGDFAGGALYRFETQDVVVRTNDRAPRGGEAPESAAAAWLAALVDADGSVTFAVDPRSRRRVPVGEMHHGRAAVLVQALAAHGAHSGVVGRARRRLSSDVQRALEGATVPGWPEDPERTAGTVALAVLAGVPLESELLALVRARPVRRSAWHAGQVVAALGARAPADVWTACVADLDAHPFAPWTLMAATARGDTAVRDRAARALEDSIRVAGPHRGGVSITPVPEVALTAVAVEALARVGAAAARSAARRGRSFLASMQLVEPRLYAALDPALARGAFPASPVVDLLRCDVTAHALLAMQA
jgi:AMMECR1 domain-containing protein